MAGERKGITYEAIVKLALEELVGKGTLVGSIFWNEKQEAMTIEPDFTVGADKDHPTHIFLVTHSGSAKNSDMKFWRNIGELSEAKTALFSVPAVFSIVFDAEIKRDLILVQAAAFDNQLIVGEKTYGPAIAAWIEERSSSLPSPKDKKLEALRSLLGTNAQLRQLVRHLTTDVEAMLPERRSPLDALWNLHRKRSARVAPIARETFYRRAFAKAMVIGVKPQSLLKTLPGDWEWVLPLGIVTQTIAGYRVVDPDLVWLSKSNLAEEDTSKWPSSAVSQGFRNQLQKVRSIAILSCYRSYVTRHLSSLKTQSGMKRHLVRLHADPLAGITLPDGVLKPTGLWLFDFIGALVRAKAKKAQAFGFSSFSSHHESGAFKVGTMNVGTWCTCFSNQYFSRSSGFTLPPGVLEFISLVLSESLQPFSVESIDALAAEIEAKYVSKELEAVLLAHRGFDPIRALLLSRPELAGAENVRIRAGFAEHCAIRGSAASTGVLKKSRTAIYWQTAHGSHTNDKRKELCGRAMAIRYAWDTARNHFRSRMSFDRLLLILDGTWTQSDLEALLRAGWDEIFYPDEMDKLVKAVI